MLLVHMLLVHKQYMHVQTCFIYIMLIEGITAHIHDY